MRGRVWEAAVNYTVDWIMRNTASETESGSRIAMGLISIYVCM